MGDTIHWIRAPAHMGLEGNEIANNLVLVGMCQSLSWEVVSVRVVCTPLVGPVLALELGSSSVSSHDHTGWGEISSGDNFGGAL